MFRTQVFVALLSLAASFGSLVHAQNSGTLVISNDDGWATAQIRAQFEALTGADYDVCVIPSSSTLNKTADGGVLRRSSCLAQP